MIFTINVKKKLNSGIKPNKAHNIHTELEKTIKINIITQNIDHLHELAGNSSIISMHRELIKVRCISNDSHIHHWVTDLNETHKCPEMRLLTDAPSYIYLLVWGNALSNG